MDVAASTIDENVLDLLRARSPLAQRLAPGSGLPADLPLGTGGLGMDSIALVELLLEVEQRFAVSAAAELLAGPPLTVGLLLAHLHASGSG